MRIYTLRITEHFRENLGVHTDKRVTFAIHVDNINLPKPHKKYNPSETSLSVVHYQVLLKHMKLN